MTVLLLEWSEDGPLLFVYLRLSFGTARNVLLQLLHPRVSPAPISSRLDAHQFVKDALIECLLGLAAHLELLRRQEMSTSEEGEAEL